MVWPVVNLYLEARNRNGKIYSRALSRDDKITEVLARIEKEENLVPGELIKNHMNVVDKPDETFPGGGDEQMDYILTEDRVIYHAGVLAGMSKFLERDGFCHVPPQCIKKEHDCHVLRQYGGLRNDQFPCNCGLERTEGEFVCCALVYFRRIAQYEDRLKMVGLLKMNKQRLMQQIQMKWLLHDEGQEMRIKLWKAAQDIRIQYRQGIRNIRLGKPTGVTQTFANAVLEHGTPTGAPLDEFLKDRSLKFLVGQVGTVPFTREMWPKVEEEIKELIKVYKEYTK